MNVVYFCLFKAEARLAARRQARYEARNIRMRELERKQKEEEVEVGSGAVAHQQLLVTTSSNSNHNNVHALGKLDIQYT